MGRMADEHLPEVVPGQQQPPQQPPPQQYYYYQPQTPQGISPEETSASPLPQVVPDSSPELAQQRYYIESDKIPAYYDTAPKLPYEPIPTPVDQQQQQQQYYQPSMVSAISPNSSVPWQSFPVGGDDQANVDPEPPRERRICGLPKRRFIIIAVILGLVIIGAAIGGGVGGAMAARRSSDESEPPAETTSAPETTSSTDAAPTSSPPTTTASTPTSTSTSATSTTSSAPSPSITFLHNQTDPAAFRIAFQGFEKPNFEGKHTPILYEEGFYDLGFPAVSYAWLPTISSCCVTFCASKTEAVGWLCDPRKKNRTDSGKGFPRISIWCGRYDLDNQTKMKDKCS